MKNEGWNKTLLRFWNGLSRIQENPTTLTKPRSETHLNQKWGSKTKNSKENERNKDPCTEEEFRNQHLEGSKNENLHQQIQKKRNLPLKKKRERKTCLERFLMAESKKQPTKLQSPSS